MTEITLNQQTLKQIAAMKLVHHSESKNKDRFQMPHNLNNAKTMSLPTNFIFWFSEIRMQESKHWWSNWVFNRHPNVIKKAEKNSCKRNCLFQNLRSKWLLVSGAKLIKRDHSQLISLEKQIVLSIFQI